MERDTVSNTNVNPVVILDLDKIDELDQPMPEQSEEDELRLMRSIQEHGMLEPIVVISQDNGRYQVVDGRTRRKIAIKLGYKTIQCIYKEDYDELTGKALSYELELYRRHLSKQDHDRLHKELTIIKKSYDNDYHAHLLRKLSPEMRLVYKSVTEKGEISPAMRSLFFLITKLPQSDQRAFFERSTAPDDDNIKDLEKRYDEHIDELNKKIDELDTQNKQLKTVADAYEKAKASFKVREAEAIKKKTDELERKYKEENLSGTKIQSLIEEEKQKIAAKFKNELLELNADLQELSKSREKTQQQLDYMRDQIKTEEGKRKEHELILKKKNDEIEYHKQTIKTLANTTKITSHLQITADDLQGVFKSLTMLGNSKLENKQKEDIKKLLNTISDRIILIENYIDEPKAKSNAA